MSQRRPDPGHVHDDRDNTFVLQHLSCNVSDRHPCVPAHASRPEPTGLTLDTARVAEIRRRMAYETDRTAPPDGFPKLPDLPLGRYTDPALYALEIEQVFKRSWLYALHATEVPEEGSFRLLDIPLAPVVVVRGNDGALRAFMNSCRHRGAPVVRDLEGVTKLLVCQYHSWSYDLQGNLVRVPDERDFVDLCKEDRPLVELRCEQWGGFVFINLDGDAPH